jgi:hypothetical protein
MTIEELREIIRAEMEDLTIPKQVAEILEKFEGKKPSKRMATAIKKEMDVDVYYERPGVFGGMTSIWKGDYDNRISFYFRNDIFSIDAFKKENVSLYAAAEERNEERIKLLNDRDRLLKLCDAIDKCNEAVKVYNNYKRVLEEETTVCHVSKLVDSI